jgi:transposase
MPFQSRKAKLKLSEEELQNLETISRSRMETNCRVERAKIIIEYNNGANISEIARLHKTNRPKIERQINKALQIGAIPSLDDLPRAGRKEEITEEAQIWILSLACSKPIDYGYSYETWTMSLLASYAREK